MKTALETFFGELEMLKMKLNFKQINSTKYYSEVKKAYKDCLEKEEKQIKGAWLSAWKDSMINPLKDEFYQDLADEYFSETYKSKEP
jgi:hypothetical protein